MYKSRSYKKVLAALSFAESNLAVLAQQNQEWKDDLAPLFVQGLKVCENCYKILPQLLVPKDIRKFSTNLKNLDDKFFSQEIDVLSVLTFICFTLEEPIAKSGHAKLVAYLKELADVLMQLVDYFEKKYGEAFQPIKHGDDAYRFWSEIDW